MFAAMPFASRQPGWRWRRARALPRNRCVLVFVDGTRHTPRRAASAARGDGGGGDAAEPLGCHPPMDKERLSCGVSVVATGLQRHGEGARSFNDFDRSANRKTELAVSAPLTDGDFGKPR